MTDQQRARMIRGLLEERAVADMRGRKDKVAEIDKQLRHYGHNAKPPAKRAEKRSDR